MSIPEGIKEAIENGIVCPKCKEGNIHLRCTHFGPELYCNKCYKKLVIEYKEEPFEILDIKEERY